MSEYIEREALMKNFCGFDLTECVKYGNKTKEQAQSSFETLMMYEIADVIEDAPAADVAPAVHGRWIEVCDTEQDILKERPPYKILRGYRCSICKRFEKKMEPYCNCGAKMDLEE